MTLADLRDALGAKRTAYVKTPLETMGVEARGWVRQRQDGRWEITEKLATTDWDVVDKYAARDGDA